MPISLIAAIAFSSSNSAKPSFLPSDFCQSINRFAALYENGFVLGLKVKVKGNLGTFTT